MQDAWTHPPPIQQAMTLLSASVQALTVTFLVITITQEILFQEYLSWQSMINQAINHTYLNAIYQ